MADLINNWLRKQSDIILAVGVVAIVSMLVIRLSPGTMDYVIATNISIGVLVLLVSLYIQDASRLPSFPTILLLSTLFRLAINVSTTRLILLEADAGEIITAFGQFVVGGNFVVGGVVFIVLVLIQFIVIAKGSERVAEVAARFTLDAMPGKQMAIDNDLRNEMISPAQAKQRRSRLERESKLYGAMDGAMKFVKGDAIAGIVISIINITGGLIVGVMQQGMTVSEAAEVYSLLTIGDGLVSQIPALLISVSAGLVVTRVAQDDEATGSQVAGEMLDQILHYPRALGVVAALLFVLGLSSSWTGFPMLPFLALGVFAIMLAVAGFQKQKDLEAAGAPLDAAAAEEEAEEAAKIPMPEPVPIVLDLGHAAESIFLSPDGGEYPEARGALDAEVRDRLTQMMGIPFPAVNLRIGNPLIETNGYLISLFDTPVAEGEMDPAKLIALCTIEEIAEAGIEAETTKLPWGRATVCLIDEDDHQKAQEAGIRTASMGSVILQHVAHVVEEHASEFIGVQEASDMVDRLREKNPALVQATIPTVIKIQQVAAVLKGLLKERAPVRDFRLILETLGRIAETEKDTAKLVERVRIEMNRALCANIVVGRVLRHYRLDHEITDMISKTRVDTAQGPVLDMPPDTQEFIVKAIDTVIDPQEHITEPAVLVVRRDLRPLVRDLIHPTMPEVYVLGDNEVSDTYEMDTIELVTLEAAEAAG